MTKEKLILSIMKEAEADGEPITREEAEEMAEMEIKAKGIKVYEQAEDKKPRKPRERKIDEDKLYLLMTIKDCIVKDILEPYKRDTTTTMKNETELSFGFEGNQYTIKLIKHRPPKA